MLKTKNRKPCEAPKIERIINDDPRLHHMFDVGTVAHQGDLIFVCIHNLPKSAKPRKTRQLADGSTQGSRHVMERGDVYDCEGGEVVVAVKKATGIEVDNRYVGPVFVSPADPTADDLTHPEHGNQGFPAGTVCAVIVQRNIDAEMREQRVED